MIVHVFLVGFRRVPASEKAVFQVRLLLLRVCGRFGLILFLACLILFLACSDEANGVVILSHGFVWRRMHGRTQLTHAETASRRALEHFALAITGTGILVDVKRFPPVRFTELCHHR